MRTTIDLTPDAWQIAKTVAREQNRSLGKVVSDFITGDHLMGGVHGRAAAPVRSAEGVFPTFRCVRRVTSEDVRALEDE